MAPSYSYEDSELVHQLIKVSNNNPKLIKHSDYVAPAAPEMTIRSWRMNEFKYYEIPSPFPTLARGLFTTEAVEEGKKRAGKNKEYRLVIRGYDKFFNIGEVPWTTVCIPIILNLNFNSFFLSVGIFREPYRRALYAFFEIQRMYHLHRRPHIS